VGDRERCLADSREQHVCEQVQLARRQAAVPADRLQAAVYAGERVELVKRADALPPHHPWRIDENDPLQRRVEYQLEPSFEPRLQSRERIGGLARRRRRRPRREFGDGPLKDRVEQRLLAREVVIERPSGDPGALQNCADRGSLKAMLAEQLARGRDQPLTRRRSSFNSPVRHLAASIPTDGLIFFQTDGRFIRKNERTEIMGKTIMGVAAISLDGFIADEKDDVGPLFDWLGTGDVSWALPGSDQAARSTQASADFMMSHYGNVAANVIGRRLFDLTNGWDGAPAAYEHVFVVTHEPPRDWEYADTAPFTFVDGVKEAIAAAKEFAGDRDVDVAGGQIGSQALELGLIDQVVVNQVPVVFGSGRPFFATGGLAEPLRLENPTTIVEGDRVTHLVYDVSR
jgi:dihydrofolate reductase